MGQAATQRPREAAADRAEIARPSSTQRLLVERNGNWVESVETCVKQRTACFVVVGAAHLVGPDSLVALLQKKGYKVEQQ